MLERIRMAIQSGIDGWRAFGEAEAPETLNEHYSAYLSLYDGSAFTMLAGKRKGVFKDQRVYRNIKLLYSHVAAVIDFYAAHVYQGPLATDGKRLPDGSRGAIPIDAQSGDKKNDPLLLAAVDEGWNRWNWQEGMSVRPFYGSMLGCGLTELIPDHDRHTNWPQWVWPGFVTDFTLDVVGNLKAYTLEYRVTRIKNGKEETFNFRKQVTKDFYRFWKNDAPFSDAEGHGDWEQENPYSFVPAVWDRHKRTRGDRGLSAVANTRQALYELNSMLSHGNDYQKKTFSAEVIVKGEVGMGADRVIGPSRTSDPAAYAETQGYVNVGADGGVEILQFDIGKTLEILEWIKQGILDANPEANFYNELRKMSQLTGPGAERALGDAVSRLTMARAMYDPNSVKISQMNIAMSGEAIKRGWWTDLTKRDEVFQPFDLDSHKAGQLDMVILPRPVVPETEAERLQLVLERERVQYPDSLVSLGEEETKAAAIIAAREAADLRRVNVF